MFTRKIGIDLGTANTIVFVPGRGFIINEPTIVALSHPDNTVLAVGREAKDMIGRTPDDIIAYRPMKDGVIADYYITKAMLKYFIAKATGALNLFRPEVVISVPAGISPTEKRAVVNAAREAGACVCLLKGMSLKELADRLVEIAAEHRRASSRTPV